MIFDNINNIKNYSEMQDIYKALIFLSNINKDTCPKEKVSINGDKITANTITLTSKPIENCIFEAHKKYIDIHYIVAGTEGISTRNTSELTPVDTFNKDNDIGFYTGVPSGTYYLKPREFMICWPEDAHRVAMMDSMPENIMKIVIKIKISEDDLHE